MPLLNKEPFSRIPLPESIDSDDEVYYCSSTQEAFTDYEAFFERAILCSSMVWTCSVTGRNGLTFQEALESEETAKSTLNSFPESLQMPVLFLVKCMNEHKFNHIVHMVSTFISNRYFVGEEVYVIVNDKKIKGRIERVISPTEAELIASSKKNNEKTIAYGCDPSLFKYDIVHVLNKDLKVVVSADCVARAKGTISKDKVKLFLKQHITAEKRFQKMKIKDSSLVQFGVENICWNDLFAGPFPNFTSETQVIQKYKTKNSDDNVNTSSENKKKYKKVCRELEGVKEAFKQLDKDLLKKQKLEQKVLERERMREERRQRDLILQEWNKKREDLQCDDLQPLPESIPVDCLIPNELFGDSIMIMEFFYNFRELFGIKVVFPSGITFEILQEILTSQNIYGPFGDLVDLLLRTIFALQEEEKCLPILPEELKSSDDDSDNESAGVDSEIISALKAAKSTSTVLLQCHSVSLNGLPISPFDITEMVRLHILTSGAGERINRNHRGWFSGREDSCLSFKRGNPEIIEFLADHTIFELCIADRLKLLHALINQIVTFSRFRDYIEETADKVSELKRDLRELEKSLKPENKGDKNSKQKKEAVEAVEVNEPSIETRLRTNKECKKIEELKYQIRELQSVCRLKPLGVDRLCRKYWWFNSLNGLFVERDDVSLSTCTSRCSSLQDLALKSKCSVTLEDIKHSTVKCNNSYSYLSNEDRSTASDKENDCVTPPKSISNIEKCHRLTSRSTLVHLVKDGKNYCFPGNSEVIRDCKWSFYFKSEDIEALISSLNNRGFRESEFKKVLKRDEKFLIQALQLCPVNLLNSDISKLENFDRVPRRIMSRTQTSRLNYGKQKLIKFADLSSENAMEAAFKFNCLKLEEKLFDGGLCVVDERNEWRAALQNENKIMTLEECIQYFLNLVLSIQVQFLKESFKKEDGSFVKWKDSLLNCKSFSQLFFHKITLEKNIIWSKIASNAACIVCSTKKHPGKMLLCDECNSGFHTYCINPPLENIPVGEWFCSSCAELRKPLSPRKVRQNKIQYTEKSSGESSSSSSDSSSESDIDSSEDAENAGNNKIEKNMTMCVICKKNNVDVNCSNCGRNFHNKCHSPPITRPLRKKWACFKCHSTDNSNQEEFSEPQQKRMKTRYNQDYDYENQNPIEKHEKAHEKKRQTRSVTNTDTNMKKCIEILTKLKSHRDAVHFIKCPTSKEAPNYNSIIKRHVDFNLVTSKLNSTQYKSDDEFILDIYLIMQNCWLYWGKFTEPYRAAKRLFIFLKQLLSEYGFEKIKGSLN